jgi:hypothetical protein
VKLAALGVAHFAERRVRDDLFDAAAEFGARRRGWSLDRADSRSRGRGSRSRAQPEAVGFPASQCGKSRGWQRDGSALVQLTTELAGGSRTLVER